MLVAAATLSGGRAGGIGARATPVASAEKPSFDFFSAENIKKKKAVPKRPPQANFFAEYVRGH